MKPTNYQSSLQSALWLDVNTNWGINNLPDRVANSQAIIYSSLYNLFNCIPGQRGRTFEPEYGSLWMQFIHEPINDLTAAKMQIFMIDSIGRWEPRIVLNLSETEINADLNLPGYVIRIGFSIPGLETAEQISFQLSL